MTVQQDFIQACKEGNLDTVNFLLENHYHPNQRFHRMRQILGYEIDLNRLAEGMFPLMWAAYGEHKAIVKRLLTTPGILINKMTKQNHSTALTSAIGSHNLDIVKALLETPGILVNPKGQRENNALVCAAIYGRVDMVTLLLSASDMNVNLQLHKDGKNALMYAAEMLSTEVVTTLLAHPHINLNLKCHHGNTALIYAAKNGATDIVEALLAMPNINIHETNNQGHTAIIEAYEEGYEEVINILERHGAILPAHLNGRRAQNRINQAQSVHEVSVHFSVSRSAENLLKQYSFTPKEIKEQISHLNAWLNTFPKSAILISQAMPTLNSLLFKVAILTSRPKAWLTKTFPKVTYLFSQAYTWLKTKFAGYDPYPGYKVEWLEPAKNCIANLSKIEFTDQRSHVTMQEVLALVWAGITNPRANGENKPALSAQELTNRRMASLKHFYEIQRGYNLSNSANPKDKGGKDSPTCVSGAFNKLIGLLNEVGHEGVQIIFVTRATIILHAPALTCEAFEQLSDKNKKRFAQEWEGENSEAIQAECFDLLKKIVEKKLHNLYDEFSERVPHFAQVITDAVNNVQFTDLDKVMDKARSTEIASSVALPADELPIAPEPVVFTQITLSNNSGNLIPTPSEATGMSERRYPARLRKFTGSYKV